MEAEGSDPPEPLVQTSAPTFDEWQASKTPAPDVTAKAPTFDEWQASKTPVPGVAAKAPSDPVDESASEVHARVDESAGDGPVPSHPVQPSAERKASDPLGAGAARTPRSVVQAKVVAAPVENHTLVGAALASPRGVPQRRSTGCEFHQMDGGGDSEAEFIEDISEALNPRAARQRHRTDSDPLTGGVQRTPRSVRTQRVSAAAASPRLESHAPIADSQAFGPVVSRAQPSPRFDAPARSHDTVQVSSALPWAEVLTPLLSSPRALPQPQSEVSMVTFRQEASEVLTSNCDPSGFASASQAMTAMVYPTGEVPMAIPTAYAAVSQICLLPIQPLPLELDGQAARMRIMRPVLSDVTAQGTRVYEGMVLFGQGYRFAVVSCEPPSGAVLSTDTRVFLDGPYLRPLRRAHFVGLVRHGAGITEKVLFERLAQHLRGLMRSGGCAVAGIGQVTSIGGLRFQVAAIDPDDTSVGFVDSSTELFATLHGADEFRRFHAVQIGGLPIYNGSSTSAAQRDRLVEYLNERRSDTFATGQELRLQDGLRFVVAAVDPPGEMRVGSDTELFTGGSMSETHAQSLRAGRYGVL